MKLRKLISLVALLVVGSCFCAAQDQSTLSGVIAFTYNWNGATVTFNLNNPGGTTPVDCSTGNAVPLQYTFTTDSGANISGTVYRNDRICPSNTTYTIVVNPLATNGPFTTLQKAINASTFNVATYVNPQLGALSFPCVSVCYGYNTNEVITAQTTPGSLFFNVSTGASSQCNLWSGAIWINCSSASGVLPILYQSGAPTAPCTIANANAQFDLDYTNLIGYVCKALPGPTYLWGELTWEGVGTTNTPGTNSNYVCLSTGVLNTCTWQALSSITGLPTLISNGAPTASCSNSSPNNNGQQDIDYTNLILYTCVGASSTWKPNTWQGVTATNTPGTSPNQACISNGSSNQCNWQTIGSLITTAFSCFAGETSSTPQATIVSVSGCNVTLGSDTWIACRTGNNTITTASSISDTLANTWTVVGFAGPSNNPNMTLFHSLITHGGSDTITCTPPSSSAFQSMTGFSLLGMNVGSLNVEDSIVNGGVVVYSAFVSTTQRTFNVYCGTVSSNLYSPFPLTIYGAPSSMVSNATSGALSLSGAGDMGCEINMTPNAMTLVTASMQFQNPSGTLSSGFANINASYDF